MAPLYVGMPPTDRTYEVGKWGNIRCGGQCKDDYQRLVTYAQTDHRLVVLQRAALEAFKDAEQEVRKLSQGLIWLTGSHRTCSSQTSLYKSDPSRFAPPNTTAHTRGLAIDVSMSQSSDKLRRIHKELSDRHWFQARPTDEPWHYSFGIEV